MAILSMTGFGRGRATRAPYTVEVEISSVNRKQLEVRFSLPRELAGSEAALRLAVQKVIGRGAVSFRVTIGGSDGAALHVDIARLKALAELCRSLHSEIRDGCREFSVPELLALPGVMNPENGGAETPELTAAVTAATAAALQAFQAMRTAEGEALARELAGRLEGLRELLAAIQPAAAAIEGNLRNRLLEKLAALGLTAGADDERLLKEVLFYADKSDVTEELTRLESHFAQFREFLDTANTPGRSLDFLIQEMFREITTLGNKAGVPEITPKVIAFKAELEKLREQIQNIE